MTTIHNTHTCACGNTIDTCGWNNNMNAILRCQDCTEKRQALLAEINATLTPESETVYVSGTIRHLILVDDFTTVEVSYRRPEKMNGLNFQVA